MSDERLSTADLVADEDAAGRRMRGRDADQPVARDEDALEPLLRGRSRGRAARAVARLQSRFVDDPRETVSEADSLVAELLQELARGFSDARGKLESQWSEGDDVSTEDLRISLKRYRSFFERLLSV